MQAIEIETEVDENHEIRIKLPDSAAGAAKVIVLFEENKPTSPSPMKLGLFEGKIHVAEDFDEPLPDEFWLSGKP